MIALYKHGMSLLVAALLASFGALGVAQAADEVTIEVVVSKPKAGVSLEALLAADKDMEQQSVVRQKGFIDRSVGVSKDGLVVVIARWSSLEDAEAAAVAIRANPAAKKRTDLSEVILLKEFAKK